MHNQTLLNARSTLEQPLTRLLEFILVSFILLLGVSTVILMLGLHFHARFSVAAWVIFASTIGMGASMALAAIRTAAPKQKWARADTYCLSGILLISLCGAMLTISIKRSDMDDSIYLPQAVFYAENPGAPLDTSITWIVVPDKIPSFGVLRYYELTQAAFSVILGVKFLDFYYLIFPGFVGFLICLSMFLLLRIFVREQNIALLSIGFLILLMMALGETHRAYGNLTITRAFHAKFMFLSVGLPSWVYFSLRYFLVRDRLSWLALTALGVGMTGATPSAMVFIPFLALAIIVAYYFNEGSAPVVSRIKLAVNYFATLLPLVIITIPFYYYATHNIGAGSLINSSFPRDFLGQVLFLLNPRYPLTPIVFALSLIVVAFRSDYRRFFIAWVVIIIALFFNPLVCDFVINNLTTQNIYWRLFYLLPFPLMACVAFSILVKNKTGSRTFTYILFSLLAYAAFLGPTSVLRPENRATIGLPGYKIELSDFTVSQKIVAGLPPGSMLAPLELSSNVLLLSSRYPQIHMAEDCLGLALSSVEHAQDFDERVRAYAYLYKQDLSENQKASFVKVLAREKKPDYVVVRVNSVNRREATQILLQAGYNSRYFINDKYEVFGLAKA